MDSMETRLRSLVEQGFHVSLSADRRYSVPGEPRTVRFSVRLTRYDERGASQITVEQSGDAFDDATDKALAACEAFLQPPARQAAE